jgi:ferredoxin-NADP reductase
MEYICKIIEIEDLSYNMKKIIIEKPKNYRFNPGQAILLFINKEGWRDKKRPFTLTNLNDDSFLEFMIKRYDKGGVTQEIHKLKIGDELVIGEPFKTITYHDEGVFIAGGSGVTPFISILRHLKKEGKLGNNKLIFSNKTQKDIFFEEGFKDIFSEHPENLILTLTGEKNPAYESHRIDKAFLEMKIKSFSNNFYICGPLEMVKSLTQTLKELGATNELISF